MGSKEERLSSKIFPGQAHAYLGDLGLETAISFIREAASHPKAEIIIDQLDCTVSFTRIPSEKTKEDIISRLEESGGHFTAVQRRFRDDGRWEISASTWTMGPEDFLWIWLPEEIAIDIIKRHGYEVKAS